MSDVASVSSASEIQMNYMKLLIEQLRHQNLLEPLSNEDMATQMAQLSQLQQLETMNSNFSGILAATNRNYADSLIGQNVSYFVTNELQGYSERKTDLVDEVYHNIGGETILMVGKRNVGLEDIAESLIGKQVSFMAKSNHGTMEITSGTVSQYYKENGETILVVGPHRVGLEDVANSLVGMETSQGVVQGTSSVGGKLALAVATPINLDGVVSVKS